MLGGGGHERLGQVLKGIDCLKEAVLSVPIPGAPPRMSKDGAAVGLAFLDVALRQNHVRRLTERLTLIEHRAARCTTEVDISLGLLDESQREAGTLYQKLRNRGDQQTAPQAADGLSRDSFRPGHDLIWVPVSRISRRTHSPIDVINGEGKKLPRLTQYETSRLMASALYRLLRAILLTNSDARENARTKLSDLLFRVHEPRWLLQAALITLMTERSRPADRWQRRGSTPGTLHGQGAQHRAYALDVLTDYEEYLKGYITLLDVAVNDYLLVVALDAARDEHLLAFDSPLHVDNQPTDGWLRRPLRLAGGAYWVEYRTQVPASLRAYHLVADTEPGVQIQKMYLSTNADGGIVRELASDLRVLSPTIQAAKTVPNRESTEKILELELQSCLTRLSELLRRRRWEASQALRTLTEDQLPATNALAWAVSSGEVTKTRQQTVTDALLHHPSITSANLEHAADEIEDRQLFLDLNLENDPASDRAHVYWRRDPSRLVVGQTIQISAAMFLRDTSSSRASSVVTYVLSVVAISYLLGCLLFASFFPFAAHQTLSSGLNADAVIAVLLLVPGFLYARLDLPVRHSIVGQLRILPRFVAHVSIACTAFLAAAIAASSNALIVHIALAACVVVPTVAMLVLVAMSRAVHADLFKVSPTLPTWAQPMAGPTTGRSRARRWLKRLLERSLRKLYVHPDATFRTFGTGS